MIAVIARATRWEWFKLRRRAMPWILLVILLLFSQLGVWASFVGYRALEGGGELLISAPVQAGQTGQTGRPTSVRCVDVLAEPPNVPGATPAIITGLRAQCDQLATARAQQLPATYERFTLPGSIKQALGTASSIGGILIAVLAASTVGVEYSWGTMRTALVRGTGRWQYLAGKIAVLLLAALGALLVVVIVTSLSSAVASNLAAAPAGFVAPAWGGAFEAIGRAWFGFVPMIALVVMLTVLTSSTATGMAIGIGYLIAEPLILVLLRQLSDRFTGISDYLLAANISGWNGGASLGAAGATVGSMHHLVVLLIYTAVFVGLATWLIESRDVTKATGT